MNELLKRLRSPQSLDNLKKLEICKNEINNRRESVPLTQFKKDVLDLNALRTKVVNEIWLARAHVKELDPSERVSARGAIEEFEKQLEACASADDVEKLYDLIRQREIKEIGYSNFASGSPSSIL